MMNDFNKKDYDSGSVTLKNPDRDHMIRAYFNKAYGALRASGVHGDRKVWASGGAFFRDTFYNAESLVNMFLHQDPLSHEFFINRLKTLNGNFAVVIEEKAACYAAVDRTRGIPLFYARKENIFYISDDARWIRNMCGEKKIDTASLDEFFCAGYVTGPDTLFANIKQLQAGEYLYFDGKRAHSECLTTGRYYGYWNKDIHQVPINELVDGLDDVFLRVFGRLCTCAGGRTLVVPLSGGLDSRLVVSMLKRLKYENVICFSYGRRDNWESRKSREIADTLQYKWLYIEYAPKKWRLWRRSAPFQRYFNYADNLASLPHIDDWGAVREMKEANAIPDDSIFAPGHTGDFISGGHLRYVFGASADVTEDALIERIIEKHFGLWPQRLKDKTVASEIRSKINYALPKVRCNTAQDIASSYECWEWQERQSKFIVNSVRVYDFWDFEWRLPLWDAELMDFWVHIPLAFKLDKKLYAAYLSTIDPYGVFKDSLEKFARARLMEDVSRQYSNTFSRKLFHYYRLYKRLLEYIHGPKAAYGMYNLWTLIFNITKIRNPNSLLVKEYLEGLSEEATRTPPRLGSTLLTTSRSGQVRHQVTSHTSQALGRNGK